jgi:ABC-2 type transport system ATP-binding protein
VLCGRPVDHIELPAFADATKSTIAEDGRTLIVTSTRPARTLVELIKWIDQQGIELEDVHLKRPSLEDVFIDLTGKKLRE